MNDRRFKLYATAAAVFALDRLTKWLIETHVSFNDTYRIVPGFFDIVHSQNRGVAFGLFNDGASGWSTGVLSLFSLAAVLVISAILWNAGRPHSFSEGRWSQVGLALILGGAVGNLFDRIVWGRVTDFLELYIGDYHWPTFNVADSAIVIGSGLLLVDLLRAKRQAANVP
ncbi:MAG: signal peptidase II [Acidobacteriia bacterium]|nr:signal peptidase II [Terriglobia bacterium]MBV8902610.1 signal peptidase II [Terriglobia bacterium]